MMMDTLFAHMLRTSSLNGRSSACHRVSGYMGSTVHAMHGSKAIGRKV